MKRANSRSEYATIEYLSFTLTQVNQDESGKQTVNRSYWSTRKKVNHPDKNNNNLLIKDSHVVGKSNRAYKRKEQKHAEMFTQLSLFPTSKQ